MSGRPMAGSPAEPVVEIDDLTVQVRLRSRLVTLVSNLSYSVPASGSLAIVGESGAGKSIGVRAVLGLLDEHKFVVSGRIRIGGVDVGSLSKAARRRHLTRNAALVFQDPSRSLNPTMRVGRQIAEAMLNGSGRTDTAKRSIAKQRTIELMSEVGIAAPHDRFHAFPHELSGGMKQRIVIAIALACRPQVIFCDEPTSALDVTTQADIMDLLDELRARTGVGLVVITHDLALAASRAEQVIVMYGGTLMERLPAAGLVKTARVPYTNALVAAVPDAARPGRPPRPIPGHPPDPMAPPPGCPFSPRCAHADEQCDTQPPLVAVAGGHEVRCRHPQPGDPGSETSR